MEKRNIINGIAIGEQPKWSWLREKLTGDDVPCSWSIALFYLLSFISYLSLSWPEITCINATSAPCPPGRKRSSDPRTAALIFYLLSLILKKNPVNIISDKKKDALYRALGYEVVRIPYFIQLTNQAVRQLFHREVAEPLFNPRLPSLFPELRNTPAFLCPLGIRRMAREFHAFPEQYQVNAAFLQREQPPELTGLQLLRYCYEHP